jgi:hypothetical protein
VALSVGYTYYNGYWNTNGDLGSALFANALGGGLQGSVLANGFGYPGTVFNTFVDSHSLTDSATKGLYLVSQFAPGNYRFGGAINTYLNANALQDDPNGFLYAGALTNGGFNGPFGNTYATAALANAFGGGLQGALLANRLYGNGYYNGGGYGPGAYAYYQTYY